MSPGPGVVVRQWSERTYAIYVDGVYVGTAPTRREAQRYGENRCNERKAEDAST